MINVSIFRSKTKDPKKIFLHVGIYLTNEEKNLKGEEKENFIRKKALTSKGKRNIKENIITNQTLKTCRFFRKATYCPVGKNNCKWWACGEVGHYANEYKNRKNNKFIEILGSLHHFELSDEEAIDLKLKNKWIVEIVLDYE